MRGRLLLGDRPAAGVTVSAIPYEPPEVEARRLARGGEAPRPIATVTTRADGTFAVAVAATPAATFHLLAEGGGAIAAWVGGPYDTSESDDLGERALTRAETLAGRVVGASGAPIAGAAVTVRPLASPASDPDVTPAARTVITGADGVFRAGAAADGNRVTVAAKSYAAAVLASVRAGAMPRPIALGLGALVSGVVVGSDRKTPAAGALVRYEGDGLETAWTEAGADGRFALADLPARAGAIVAEAGDAGLGAASTGPLPLPPGRVITVVLAPAASLEGRVLDTKTRAPVPRARLAVEDGPRTRTTRSGPDGRYQVRGLAPQRPYRVRADEPRYTAYVRDRVLLATGETVRLDVPLTLAASLSGRVVDEGGRPVTGALVRIVPPAQGGMPGRLRVMRGAGRLVFRTSADGTFHVTRLAAGEDQRLTVAHPDFEPKTIGGLSLAPGSAKAVNVVLRRGLTLAGRVRDEAGRPVSDAEIEVGGGSALAALGARALGGAALAAARPRATSGADGRFEVKGLSEGTYSLASRSRATPTTDSIASPSTRAAATRSRSRSPQGHRSAAPSRGATVAVRRATGCGRWPRAASVPASVLSASAKSARRGPTAASRSTACARATRTTWWCWGRTGWAPGAKVWLRPRRASTSWCRVRAGSRAASSMRRASRPCRTSRSTSDRTGRAAARVRVRAPAPGARWRARSGPPRRARWAGRKRCTAKMAASRSRTSPPAPGRWWPRPRAIRARASAGCRSRRETRGMRSRCASRRATRSAGG